MEVLGESKDLGEIEYKKTKNKFYEISTGSLVHQSSAIIV